MTRPRAALSLALAFVLSTSGTFGTSVFHYELRGVQDVRIVCNAFGLPDELLQVRGNVEKQARDLLFSGGMSATIVDDNANFQMRISVEPVDLGCCDGYLVEVWIGLSDEVAITRIPEGQRGRHQRLSTWSAEIYKVIRSSELEAHIVASVDELIGWFLDDHAAVQL